MFKLSIPIPHSCYLAFSGGSDSSALLHFANHPKRNLTLLYVYYPDYQFADTELAFVRQIASSKCLPLQVHIAQSCPPNTSKEAWWSSQRNSLFQSLDKPVITAHNLDDTLEWYIMTSTRGSMIGKLISITNKNVLRPLLFTTKSQILQYLNKYNLTYFEDPTNLDVTIPRNNIRHNVIPFLVQANPGIYTSLIKKYQFTSS